MTLLVEVCVDWAGLGALWMLGDHHLRAARIELGDDPAGVEGLVLVRRVVERGQSPKAVHKWVAQ